MVFRMIHIEDSQFYQWASRLVDLGPGIFVEGLLDSYQLVTFEGQDTQN